jgi:hypothetical protein
MSQFKKAMKALANKKSTLFNSEYAVVNVGTLSPSDSYKKYTNLSSNSSLKSKSPANIVQKAFKNIEAQYGSRPSSPYNINANSNLSFKPINNKSRKQRRKSRRSFTRKATRKN